MARAQRKTKTTKLADKGLSGVSYDEAGPVYEEELTEDQRAIRHAAANGLRDQIDQLDSDFLAVRKTHRTARKALVRDERELRDSARLGVARVSAQKALPGVEDEVKP